MVRVSGGTNPGARVPYAVMRSWFAALFLLLPLVSPALAEDAPSLPPEAAGVPPLLFDALSAVARDYDRWAYTETLTVIDSRGVPKVDTVVRFDPSKPYGEQYQPLKVNGQPPTERQLKAYRRRGEKRGERLEQEAAEGRVPGTVRSRFKFSGGTASIDLAQAKVVAETPDSVTFDVPLRRDGWATIPVEKFQLLARVNRRTRAFENVTLRLLESFRLMLIVKVKSGDATIEFGTVDPKHAPTVVAMTGDAAASMLFKTMDAQFDLKHTDFKRVKPYSERFGVKIGPLKALDF